MWFAAKDIGNSVTAWPYRKAGQKGALIQEKFEGKMDSLINSIADIEELFASGKIPEKAIWVGVPRTEGEGTGGFEDRGFLEFQTSCRLRVASLNLY